LNFIISIHKSIHKSKKRRSTPLGENGRLLAGKAVPGDEKAYVKGRLSLKEYPRKGRSSGSLRRFRARPKPGNLGQQTALPFAKGALIDPLKK
jgi:hypothetical protein